MADKDEDLPLIKAAVEAFKNGKNVTVEKVLPVENKVTLDDIFEAYQAVTQSGPKPNTILLPEDKAQQFLKTMQDIWEEQNILGQLQDEAALVKAGAMKNAGKQIADHIDKKILEKLKQEFLKDLERKETELYIGEDTLDEASLDMWNYHGIEPNHTRLASIMEKRKNDPAIIKMIRDRVQNPETRKKLKLDPDPRIVQVAEEIEK